MDINKWYSGKYDRAFKEVMLQSKNKGLLKSIIEHILDIKINELEIINSEKLMGNVHVKGKRLDLNLDTNIGNINLEVNSCDNKIVHRKNFSYITSNYSYDILVGEKYNYNTKYMQINLSYGLNDKVKPIDIYKVQNNEGNVYVDNFIVYNVNMEYYKNIWYNKDTKSLEKDIVLVMLGLDRKDLLELSKKYKVVSKYMKDLDKVNEDPRFRGYMTQEQEHEFMLNGYVHEAREEGIKEGKTEGLIEKQNEVISKMLSKGMTKEEISNILEIPIEEI